MAPWQSPICGTCWGQPTTTTTHGHERHTPIHLHSLPRPPLTPPQIRSQETISTKTSPQNPSLLLHCTPDIPSAHSRRHHTTHTQSTPVEPSTRSPQTLSWEPPLPSQTNTNNASHAKTGCTLPGFVVGITHRSPHTCTALDLLPTLRALIVIPTMRAPWSMSYYTVPHYNNTGTRTTYTHWSTSGSVLRKWWASSGMPPLYRGPHNNIQG